MLELRLPGITREDERHLVRRLLKIRGVEDVAWERRKDKVLIRYVAGQVLPERIRAEAARTGPEPAGT